MQVDIYVFVVKWIICDFL